MIFLSFSRVMIFCRSMFFGSVFFESECMMFLKLKRLFNIFVVILCLFNFMFNELNFEFIFFEVMMVFIKVSSTSCIRVVSALNVSYRLLMVVVRSCFFVVFIIKMLNGVSIWLFLRMSVFYNWSMFLVGRMFKFTRVSKSATTTFGR